MGFLARTIQGIGAGILQTAGKILNIK